ncbi:MAG: YqeG family HAD IIIA-type phosphatase [Ruminococcus sp.]|nr:YqeG family HAD IIIA-type phosphatase [Ruminococcus sp.]MCR5707544.1 YqeG family HAD IIIA-type phosphatase [Ruminococcus sp.]
MLFSITAAFNSVTDISPEMLARLGIRGLILDIDNTLARHNDPQPADGVVEWLETMKECGIRMIIVSNNFYLRVKLFAELVGLEYVCDSKKPFKKGYRIAAMRMGLPKHALAAVGDQLLTDVLGANLFKIKMLYTLPLGNRNSRMFRIRSVIESPFIPKKIYCRGGKTAVDHHTLKAITYKERL